MTDEPVSTPTSTGVIRRLLGLLAWAAIFVYLIVNRHTVAGVLRTVPFSVVGGMVALAWVNSINMGQGYRLILRRAGTSASLAYGTRLYVVGRVVGLFVPGGGNMYRAVKTRSDFGYSFHTIATILVGFVWLIALTSMLLALVVLVLLPGEHEAIRWVGLDVRVWVGLVAAGLAAAPAVVKKLGTYAGVPNVVRRFGEGLFALVSDKPLLVRFSGLSVIGFGLMLGTIHLAFLSVGVPVDLGMVAVFVALLRVSSLVNILPGNIGLLEMLGAVMLLSVGGDPERGVLMMLHVRIADALAISSMSLALGAGDLVAVRRGTL